MTELKSGALVCYKAKAAVVIDLNDKIEILFFKTTKRVRDKDITLLHPGPVGDVNTLDMSLPESLDSLDETLELLEGETTSLKDLADYLYGEYTPQTAWSSWMLIADGLYFEGTVDAIVVRPLALIAAEKEQRATKKAQKDAWSSLLERIKNAQIETEDYTHLVDVEQLACGERENSRIMKAIGLRESKEDAHKLLLRLGYWQEEYNPWPRRLGVDMSKPELEIPAAIECERLDLQHLTAWAIDDVGNQDPDDAISIDGDYLWVHIADASSLIAPDSELDIEARSRGTNLYLPDQVRHMLPRGITEQLGLGLHETSPALSIGFKVADNGQLENIKVCFSQIKVTRTTYGDADNALETTFAEINTIANRYRQRRMDNDAAMLDLPDVNIFVKDGEIFVEPYQQTGSRQLVGECMLAAGEAISLFAQDNNIPIPFASQPEPEEIQYPEKPSEHYAYRRHFKPSRHASVPESHFGLGLSSYTRVTSPLRRYLDLVVHQQLRAFLTDQPLLESSDLIERIGLADEASYAARKAERFSNQHWKMLYLKQHNDWQGDAIVVNIDDRNTTVIMPGLALEPRLRNQAAFELNQELTIKVTSIDIVGLRANFKAI
ncbi:MAG: RNB domain-containing ribonuclease [Thiotrichaceae bacterium]|nr:RNB domain-containing ribonuclease [Thiotrichaceae bacterium]